MAQNLLETGVQKEYPALFNRSGNSQWHGTESLKPSKGINTSTGNEPTGRGDVFVLKTNTSAPFGGGASKDTPPPKASEPVFKGFKDLTTRIVDQLKGHDSVSRQYIRDLTNHEGIKQAERDMVRKVLDEFAEGKVKVTDFANKVKTELLPLTRDKWYGVGETRPFAPRYESINLQNELRGPVANYNEHIYESPIKTSAGGVHFSAIATPNYFAHTRVEDLPGKPRGFPKDSEIDSTFTSGDGKYYEYKGDTRRVIEIQSDLFQKGRFEQEQSLQDYGHGIVAKSRKESDKIRLAELAKLEPYRNTWHERIIREEVKQAAVDGKTKLQFPTGETAMKIEGLGETSNFRAIANPDVNSPITYPARIEDLRVGAHLRQGEHGTDWIITDVLGDGKFKAVQKLTPENVYGLYNKYKNADGELDVSKIKWDTQDKKFVENLSEQFDISGKVDTDNPIFKFYEKEVGRYLTNKYGANRITDPQGVQWWEISVKKEYARSPIEAFGTAPLFNTNHE